MTEYLIAKCGRCGAVWAMDFQPDQCVCEPHPDDALDLIDADDYEAALELCPWGRS